MTSSDAKLWGGCFSEDTNKELAALNCSLNTDKRLFNEDIDGSRAYAKALENVGLLTYEELEEILHGLETVRVEWIEKKIQFISSDEDVHTVNERRLTEIIGPTGGKLHTGRSRNDQVVTDMKLWMKKAIQDIIKIITNVIEGVLLRSREYIDIIMPGYTHLQRAQPIRFSHWILSYGFSLQTDLSRFQDLYKRVDFLPLGSGAIAGNPFGIDRKLLAAQLDFQNVTPNSIVGVSDRDFVVEFNFSASLTALHLSRLAEDLILYSTKEFGFVSLSDAYTTGSSLMPQKRNPDSLELVRGISGGVFGHLCGFMMSLKGLPSTYNKDMQSDKTSIFTVFDQLISALNVTNGVIRTLNVNMRKCTDALSYDMLATDLAYFLVRKKVPFRIAHHLSGKIIAFSEQNSIPINEIPLEQLRKISPLFDESIRNIWDFEASVEQYTVIGGTAKNSVIDQIESLENFIKHIIK